MIETPARIRRIEGNIAWVTSEAPSSCGACGGKGCGSSLFARFWHPRAAEYPVSNPIGAENNEAVVIGLPEGAVLRAAFTVYAVPLLMLLGGAALGKLMAGEPGAVGGGLFALVLAAVWLKLRRGSTQPRGHGPIILRRADRRGCKTS